MEKEKQLQETTEKRKEEISNKLIPELYLCIHMNSIGISCLFREISYMYTTLQNESVRHLHDLATQHLIMLIRQR